MLIDLDVMATEHKQIPRQMPLYKKAQWDELKKHMSEAEEQIMKQANTAPANTLWILLTDSLQDAVKKFIPHKTSRNQDNLPRSCETQLIEFTLDLFNYMQDGKQTDVLIPDFSKTFDKVVHQRLICKLDYYGVTGKANSG